MQKGTELQVSATSGLLQSIKELAVKRVKAGESIPATAMEHGLSDQTLRNWVKADAAGKLTGAGSKVVTAKAL